MRRDNRLPAASGPSALLLLLTINVLPAFASPCRPKVEFDEIVSVVTEQFYDRTFNGLDWEARTIHYRGRIQCDDDADDVASTVNALLSELNASHTELYTASDLDYWGLNALFHFDDLDAYQIYFPGIWPERRNGGWFAKHVLNGSPAERAGIRPGDELITLDGADFHPLGFGGGAAVVTVSSDGRTQREVRLRTVRQSVMHAFVDASRASAEVKRAGARRAGYFRIWAAREQILESLDEALSRFEEQGVDAIILDFRGGYGGTSEEYLERLRRGSYLRRIPKYFLIDDTVRSGKEMLAAIIKRDGIGTLIGSTTAGYFLQGRMNRLFDEKYFLYVAVGGASVPGIGRIEGIGIEPDHYVAPCRMYCRGSDPPLEAAIALIED